MLKDELFDTQPAEWPDELSPRISTLIKQSRKKIVVLDDDPTGCQTVHGIPILTQWSVPSLINELNSDLPAFFILTNSRSLCGNESQRIHHEIARSLNLASEQTDVDFQIVSRGDSTLRGHFRVETETLAASMEPTPDAVIFIPYFGEGGRFTCDDIHYVQQNDILIPVGESESARDATFGFKSSNLQDWLIECAGLAPDSITSISVEEIRTGGPDTVTTRLLCMPKDTTCIVNALTRKDIEVFTLGLLHAEKRGKKYLYRSSASFVSTRSGISPKPLLSPPELNLENNNGGLIIVGSHVSRTTQQLALLRESACIMEVEINAEALVDDRQNGEIEQAATLVDKYVSMGKNVLLFTSRTLMTGATPDQSLLISGRVSQGVSEIVRKLRVRPRYIVAKGGITSHTIAVDGLGVHRAIVLGQIETGVPVWKLGEESRFPDLSYVVFPGNVGGPTTLRDLVQKLGSC